MKGHYHLQHFGPQTGSDAPWPRGGWSLYQITGDQIAQRTMCDPKSGRITERHSWCGYIGIYETLPEAMARIEEEEAKP